MAVPARDATRARDISERARRARSARSPAGTRITSGLRQVAEPGGQPGPARTAPIAASQGIGTEPERGEKGAQEPEAIAQRVVPKLGRARQQDRQRGRHASDSPVEKQPREADRSAGSTRRDASDRHDLGGRSPGAGALGRRNQATTGSTAAIKAG